MLKARVAEYFAVLVLFGVPVALGVSILACLV